MKGLPKYCLITRIDPDVLSIQAMYFIEYKELIKNLVISDLKTKYSSSVLGFAWSMLNPLMMMLVLYFEFLAPQIQ
jgi:ABC-type polysaccharide/polyol phosphate export permease